jgi:hypothetical protein
MRTSRKTLEYLAGILAQRLGGELGSWDKEYSANPTPTRYCIESHNPGDGRRFRFNKILTSSGEDDNVITNRAALGPSEFEQWLRIAINAIESFYRAHGQDLPHLDGSKIPHWEK